MPSLRTLTVPLMPAFRYTSLLGVTLLFAAATGSAQVLPGPSADLIATLESP